MTTLKGVKNISDIYKAYEEYLKANPVDEKNPPPSSVDKIIEELKKQDKFKNWPQVQLVEYAQQMIAEGNFSIIKHTMNSFKKDDGRPDNKVWNQYSYDEIIKMEGSGVNIPKKIVEWAHSMQDKDVVTYEVADENTTDNTAAESGDEKQHEMQKKAKDLTKKSKEQKNGLFTDFEKFVPLTEKATQIKKEAESAEKNAVTKAAKLIEEWKTLDKKVDKGTTLNASEQKRYKELGIQLNGVDGEMTKTIMDSASELNDLTRTMKYLYSNSEKGVVLGQDTAKAGVELADYEKGYNSRRTAMIMPFAGVTGDVADELFGAQGQSVSRDAVDTGIDLHNYSFKIDEQISTNTNAVLVEFAGNYKGELDKTVEETKKEMGDDFNTDSQKFKEMELEGDSSLNDAQSLRKGLEEQGVDLKTQGKIFAEQSKQASKETAELNMMMHFIQKDDKKSKKEANGITAFAEKRIKPQVKEYNKLVKEIEDDYENIAVQTNNNKKVNGPATAGTEVITEKDKTADDVKKEEESKKTNETEKSEETKTEEPTNTNETKDPNKKDDPKNPDETNPDENVAKSNVKTADQVSSNDPKLQKLQGKQEKIVKMQNAVQGRLGQFSADLNENKGFVDNSLSKIENTKNTGIETVSIGIELLGGTTGKEEPQENGVKTNKTIQEMAASSTGAIEVGKATKHIGRLFGLFSNGDSRMAIGLRDFREGGKAILRAGTGEIIQNESVNVNTDAQKAVASDTQRIDEVSTVEKTPKVVEQEVAEKQAQKAEGEGTKTGAPTAAKTINNQTDIIDKNLVNNNGLNVDGTENNNAEKTPEDKLKGEEKQTGNAKKDGQDAEKDTKDVDSERKDVQKNDKKTKKQSKDLAKEEKQTQKEIKQIEQELKEAEKKILELIKDTEEANAEIVALGADSGNQQPQPMAKMAQPMQNNGQDQPQTNTFSTSLTAQQPAQPKEDKQAVAQGLVARITNNSTQINLIQKTSTRKTQNLTKKLVVLNKKAIKVQKEDKKSQKDHKKLKKTIGIIDKVMSVTKITGKVVTAVGVGQVKTGTAEIFVGTSLLSNPVTAATGAGLVFKGGVMVGTGQATIGVGTIVEQVGEIGGMACKVANIAIDVAEGNLLGALMNGAALAMSCVGGIPKAGEAAEAVTAAQDAGIALGETAVETGKNMADVASEMVIDGVQTTAAEAATIGAESAVDVIKDGTKSVFGTTLKTLTSKAVLAELGSMALSSSDMFSKKPEQQEMQKRGPIPAADPNVLKRLKEIQEDRFTNGRDNNPVDSRIAINGPQKKKKKVENTFASGQKNKKQG